MAFNSIIAASRKDYPLAAGAGHSLFPTFWRGKSFDAGKAMDNLRTLRDAEERLLLEYESYDGADARALAVMRGSVHSRWAVLQHYAVCDTPMLDLTRSLAVACAFAHMGSSSGGVGYLYVFGLPFQTEAICTSEEEGVTLVDLLGITPAEAKRPLVQSGYLACDADWWRLYASDENIPKSRSGTNFDRRLLAVIKIWNSGKFWNDAPGQRPKKEDLLPYDDAFERFLADKGFIAYR